MVSIIQYDLFEKKSEYEYFKDEVQAVVDAAIASSHKVRKGLYAENGALKKKVVDLESRLEIIERNICKGVM